MRKKRTTGSAERLQPRREAVTWQKSAEINARIGQVCATAASGRELTAQLNQEFGLHWNEHAYWKRARKAGHPWPGGTLPRLTPEQSRQMDECFRELSTAGMPGTEIRETLNRKFGVGLTLAAYFARGARLRLRWIPTLKAGRPWPGAEYLPEDQWPDCFEDPAYEARHGITDRVICKECFQILHDGGMDGENGHLWLVHRPILQCDDPKKVRECYRRRHPGARLFTFQRIADDEGLDVQKMMTEFADRYATPKVRADADADRKYETKNGITEYLICREERCGFKCVGKSLKKHVQSQHGVKDFEEWRRKHNFPPIHSSDHLKRAKEHGKKLRAEQKAELTEAKRPTWRPKGFDKWPAEDQMIGRMLIENPTLGNKEIGQRLDDKSRVKCPFGGTWERSLTTPGTGANRMSFIRKKFSGYLVRPAA